MECPDTITVGELDHGEYKLFGTVPSDFFGNEKPIFSISMVKYKATIDAFWKLKILRALTSLLSLEFLTPSQ